MGSVKPKKYLGQHFLRDENIAKKIVSALRNYEQPKELLEIGPGTGVLTKYLLKLPYQKFTALDLDKESIEYLKEIYPNESSKFVYGDFLKTPVNQIFGAPGIVIGNFPYNISSQIFFRILAHHQLVDEVVCMLQKEVADRIASTHGNKVYGILSILLQTFYEIEYLFKVEPGAFNPPPKVRSAVIRLVRKVDFSFPGDQDLYFRVVKMAFQKRRKTLRNALKDLNLPAEKVQSPIFDARAEQLSVPEFISLTQDIALWKS